MRKEATNLSQTVARLEDALAKEAERNNVYSNMVKNYQRLVTSYQNASNSTLTGIALIPPGFGSAWVIAPAVKTVATSWRFTTSYQGVSTNLSLEMVPGKGRVLVNTEPLMGEVSQDTAILAKETAEKLSGMSLKNYDLVFSMTSSAEIPGVDGPSAGAAMCLLVLSIINNQSLRSNIALTGTIQPDGTIGGIGGLFEKAQAAKDAGCTVFLVPRENSHMVVYEEENVTAGWWTYVRRVPVEVSTQDYIEKNVGIEVEIVEDMFDLLALAAE